MLFLGGTTVCAAFDLKWGDEHAGSGDKKLAELRENLGELKLIIIDEVSLISADILYKVDFKLKTEKSTLM